MRNDFQKNKAKKIAVTGAGGYIGRHVVKALCDAGASVVSVCLKSNEQIDSRSRIFECDIFSLGEEAFSILGKPDALLHLAWRNGFSHNEECHIEDLFKHYSFFRNLARGGLTQLACMGSMHEVGCYEGAVNETTPCNPQSLYAVSKCALRKAAELLCASASIKFQWLRGYYIFGDDDSNNSIFSKIARAESEGKSSFPLNSGKNKYDFVFVEDLAKQIATTVLQDEVLGIIECGSGKAVALSEMVEAFIKSHGYKIRPKYGAYPDRPYDSPAIWGSDEKMRRIMEKRCEKKCF